MHICFIKIIINSVVVNNQYKYVKHYTTLVEHMALFLLWAL